jgi:hypothetical protein
MKLLVAFLLLALTVSTQSLVIQCTFQVNTNWIYLGYAYTCFGRISSFENPGIVERIDGIHLNGLTQEDVQVLQLQSQQITSIPRKITEFLPNVKQLHFSYSSISTVSAEDLQEFPELIFINFGNNKIVSINGDLFQHNLKLRYISFESNQLKNVGHNLIGNLTMLEQAYFNKNPCIDQYAGRGQFEDLNRQLPISCPPLPEFPENCSLRCTLEDETDELYLLSHQHTAAINELQSKISDKDTEIAKLQAQVEEIEMKLREIASKPGIRLAWILESIRYAKRGLDSNQNTKQN